MCFHELAHSFKMCRDNTDRVICGQDLKIISRDLQMAKRREQGAIITANLDFCFLTRIQIIGIFDKENITPHNCEEYGLRWANGGGEDVLQRAAVHDNGFVDHLLTSTNTDSAAREGRFPWVTECITREAEALLEWAVSKGLLRRVTSSAIPGAWEEDENVDELTENTGEPNVTTWEWTLGVEEIEQTDGSDAVVPRLKDMLLEAGMSAEPMAAGSGGHRGRHVTTEASAAGSVAGDHALPIPELGIGANSSSRPRSGGRSPISISSSAPPGMTPAYHGWLGEPSDPWQSSKGGDGSGGGGRSSSRPFDWIFSTRNARRVADTDFDIHEGEVPSSSSRNNKHKGGDDVQPLLIGGEPDSPLDLRATRSKNHKSQQHGVGHQGASPSDSLPDFLPGSGQHDGNKSNKKNYEVPDSRYTKQQRVGSPQGHDLDPLVSSSPSLAPLNATKYRYGKQEALQKQASGSSGSGSGSGSGRRDSKHSTRLRQSQSSPLSSLQSTSFPSSPSPLSVTTPADRSSATQAEGKRDRVSALRVAIRDKLSRVDPSAPGQEALLKEIEKMQKEVQEYLK